MGRYRFGPLGRMVPVDSPPGGWEEVPLELGAQHTSLNGTATKDVFGYKRRWSVPLASLAPTALSVFELAYRQANGRGCYFLDEQRVNRLSEAASSTLWAWSPDAPFTASNGALSTFATAGVPLLRCTTADGPVNSLAPAGAMIWAATGAGTCDATDYVLPVQPGEQVCFSLYVVAGTFTLELVPLSAGLVVGAAVTGGTNLSENLTRRYLSYTVPADGSVVAVRPRVRTTVAGSVATMAWQLEAGAIPSPWVLGSPPAPVLVSMGSGNRRPVGNYLASSLTLTEV